MPTNTFDSVPQALTQRALSANFSLEEKGRREGAMLNKDFYYGKQEQSLKLVNEDVDEATLNLTKPVVKKRTSLLYKKPLVREFEGPAQSVSFLEETYKLNNIDAFLLQVDLAAELTGTSLVHPMLQADGTIKFKMWDASAISPIASDEDAATASAISLIRLIDQLSKRSTPKNPQVQRILRSQIWTETAVVVYDDNRIVSQETNTLGFLPFVNFKGEEVHDQYLGHATTTSIRKLNALINQLLTDLGYMIKMQSATPIALSGYQSGEGLVVHPGRAISLPTGAEAKALALNPKITEVLEVIQYLEEKIFETSSVPKVTIVGGEGESGRELLVRWFPLLSVFEEKTVRYSRYELELANMTLAVAGLPPIEEVNVNWPDEDLLPLSAEEDTLEQDIKLGIRTSIDEVMRRNPQLTEMEAQAEVLANLEFTASLTSSTSAQDAQEEPQEDEEDELEENEDESNNDESQED